MTTPVAFSSIVTISEEGGEGEGDDDDDGGGVGSVGGGLGRHSFVTNDSTLPSGPNLSTLSQNFAYSSE